MNKDIERAINIIENGGIVIFPTDTAFGIGCRMDDETAVQKLFSIRRRPMSQATPVLVAGIGMAQDYLKPIPQTVKDLMLRCWPGALTVILPCLTGRIPGPVRGGGDTLGVRMPDHKITLEIIQNVGVPILGPSANFHGEPTPYSFEELDPELLKMVDHIVPGECKEKQASTVIDCSAEPWKILRQGTVLI